MYFWRIKQLKIQLIESPLGDRDVLPYLIAYSATLGLVALVPLQDYNRWDFFSAVVALVGSILGPVWIYRQNGGAAGSHLVERFLAIGWVLAIRFLVFLLPAFLVATLVADMMFEHEGETGWPMVILALAFQVIFYQRFGAHVGDVARRSAP